MQIRKKLKKLIGFENIFAKEFKIKICKKKIKTKPSENITKRTTQKFIIEKFENEKNIAGLIQ